MIETRLAQGESKIPAALVKWRIRGRKIQARYNVYPPSRMKDFPLFPTREDNNWADEEVTTTEVVEKGRY